MDAHEVETVIARLPMLVDDRDIGNKHRAIEAVHTTGDVYILGIEEKTLVEILNIRCRRAGPRGRRLRADSNSVQGTATEEHETAHEIRHVHLMIIIREGKSVALALLT